MPLSPRIVSMPAPSGGVNNTDDLFSIQKNQVYRAVNYRLNRENVFETRRGSKRLNSTALDGAITSIYDYRRPEGSIYIRYILVTAGNYLYLWEDDAARATKLRELNSTDRPTWVTFQNAVGGSIAIMANGTDFVSYDGTFVNDITFATGISNPRYLMVYDDRVLASGCDSHPFRVHICDTFDGTNWMPGAEDTEVYWLMKRASGDRVTGLGQMYDFGVIFSQFGVSILTEANPDSSTSKQIQISYEYGSTSHWSIRTVGNLIYFADENHLYRGVLRDAIENGMSVIPISENVDAKYRKVRSVTDVVSVYDPIYEEIQWGMDTKVGAAKDTILGYSVGNSGVLPEGGWNDVWAGWYEDIDPHTLAVVLDDKDKPVIWRGDSSGYLYKMYGKNQFKDENSAGTEVDIATELVTGPVYPSGISVSKRCRKFTPMAFQRHDASLKVEWVIDGSYLKPTTARPISLYNLIPYWRDSTDTDHAQLWGTTVWSARSYVPRPIVVNEPFRYIQFRLTCDGSNTYDDTAYAGGEVVYQQHGIKHTQG